jgi:hypothetical protein
MFKVQGVGYVITVFLLSLMSASMLGMTVLAYFSAAGPHAAASLPRSASTCSGSGFKVQGSGFGLRGWKCRVSDLRGEVLVRVLEAGLEGGPQISACRLHVHALGAEGPALGNDLVKYYSV